MQARELMRNGCRDLADNGMANPSQTVSNVELAAKLRANGFEPLPIKPGTKQPAVAHWQRGGVDDSAWSSESGIGILCGHGDLVAVDIDTDDPDVLRSVAAVLPVDSPRKRGSKGETLFVRAKLDKRLRIPVGLTFQDGKFRAQHVEVLTHGQQTVLPPSVHPDTGNAYEWAAGPDGVVRSLYDMRFDQVPAFEGDLQAALKRALQDHKIRADLIDACKTVASASRGSRNDALNREVFDLAKNPARMPEELARKWLTDAALHAGLAEREIAATFESAAKAGTKRSREAASKRPLSFTLFRNIDPHPRKEWLVHEFLGAGEVSCLFGQPGTGKSTIAIDLACHIASGDPWFGRRVLQGGVLYVAAERLAVVMRRMAAFRKHHDIDDIPLAVVGGPADLRTSEDHAELIIEYANELYEMSGSPIRLVVIETINQVLAGGDENHSADMGSLIRKLASIQDATGAHILTVHHCPIKAQRLRGHSSLLGMCDATILVDKAGSGYFAQIEKSNDGPGGQMISWTVESIDLHQDLETGVITSAPVVVPASQLVASANFAVTKAEVEMLRILLEAGPAGLTKEAWNFKARAEGIGDKRPATLVDVKKSLKHRGLVVEQGGAWRANLDAAQRQKYFGAE